METQTLLCLVLGLLVIAYLLRLYNDRKKYDTGSLPVPVGAHWFWGHERDIYQDESGVHYLRWFNHFGSVVRYKAAFFHDDLLAIADSRALHYIFSSRESNYIKSPWISGLLDRLIGKGLVNLEGPEHRHYRKVLNPAFHAVNLKALLPFMNDCANTYVEGLSQHLQQHKDEPTVNLDEWIAKFMLDLICKSSFDYDTQGGNSTQAVKIREAWRGQSEVGLETPAFFGQVVVRAFPWIGRLPLDYFGAQAKIRGVFSVIAEELLSVEEEGVKLQRDGSIMEKLVNALNRDGKELTMKNIVDHITTFFLAGHETSAGTTKMLCWELCRRPEMQERLRQEILDLDGDVTYDDLVGVNTRLPYLDAFLKEGLRVHPGIVVTDRMALADDELPLSKPVVTASGQTIDRIRIKKGQVLIFPLNAINCVDSIWKDGQVFRPERWLNPGPDGVQGKGEGLPAGYGNLSTFIEGRRMCIGYRFAIMQSKIFIMTLLRNFVLHDTGVEIIKRNSGTMQVTVVGRTEDRVRLPMKLTPYVA